MAVSDLDFKGINDCDPERIERGKTILAQRWRVLTTAEFRSEAENGRLGISPWSGHRDFIADFLMFARPKRVLELGVFEGCSYLAMAETIVDHGLETRLDGVDTWAGDTSTGAYGEDVHADFRRVYEAIVPDAARDGIRAHRHTFDAFAADNPTAKFDVIHFDGDHSRAATLAAYEAFLPRLAEDGVFLFHDVFPELDYESGPLWAEMKAGLPHLEFRHSWGLGILFPKGDGLYRQIRASGFDDIAHVYPIVAKTRRDRAQFALDKQWLEGVISYYWTAVDQVKQVFRQAARQPLRWPGWRKAAAIKAILDETKMQL